MKITDDVFWALSTADCLCSEDEVAAAITGMAEKIAEELSETDPVAICVMNGGLILSGQLLPKLRFPLQADYLHATRYGYSITGEDVQWIVKPSIPLEGRTVLIVDDILDEGHTLAAIVRYCLEEGAADVRTAVLVEKMHSRCRSDITADFVGLKVRDRFLFGCGMDYKGYWRNLPAIYALKDPEEGS